MCGSQSLISKVDDPEVQKDNLQTSPVPIGIAALGSSQCFDFALVCCSHPRHHLPGCQRVRSPMVQTDGVQADLAHSFSQQRIPRRGLQAIRGRQSAQEVSCLRGSTACLHLFLFLSGSYFWTSVHRVVQSLASSECLLALRE